jgi:hypothetical protein
MQDKEEFVVEREDYAFAETTKSMDYFAVQFGDGWIERPYQKRVEDARLLESLTNYSTLQAFDVDHNIREFGHDKNALISSAIRNDEFKPLLLCIQRLWYQHSKPLSRPQALRCADAGRSIGRVDAHLHIEFTLCFGKDHDFDTPPCSAFGQVTDHLPVVLNREANLMKDYVLFGIDPFAGHLHVYVVSRRFEQVPLCQSRTVDDD